MINCFKDPIHVLMSVLLCKISIALLICFCNIPSLTPHKSLKTLLVSATNDDDDHDAHEEIVDHHVSDEFREEEEDGLADGKEDEGQNGGETLILKSSLRRADPNPIEAEKKKKKKKKKKVQWVDMMGIQDLAEIREFESSEEDDNDSDRGKTCVCAIL